MEQNSYTATAKTLHWAIAFLIFVQFPLAWVMGDFEGVQKFQAYNLHKSLGITILALMVVRLFWRFLHPAPTLPYSMPRIERSAAYLGHFALYVALFLMTLSGWAMISTAKFPSVLFGSLPFPLLPWLSGLAPDDKKPYEHLFRDAHGVLANILMALIAVHILAALRHAIWLKDGTLSRMIPQFGRRSMKALAVFGVFSALAFGGSGHALATEWTVDPQKSQVAFEATGSGYTTAGKIGQFKAEIEFDPDLPQQTAIRVTLDMHSAITGASDVDKTLQSADFFNPEQFPYAQFSARGAQRTGDGKYVLNGSLTLKGVTKPISLPFSIDISEGKAKVKAETTINRLDFGVGPESVAGLPVDKDVKLTIDLTAIGLTD